MALASTTVWEIQTGGSDTASGGGFNPARAGAGTDYSQATTPTYSPTDLAAASTSTTLTSAAAGFTSAMVGNVIRITAGTNAAAGHYEITAFTNSTTVTLDRTPTSGGAMSGGTGYVGGCLASPGYAASVSVAGNDVYIKAGTYAITSTSNNVSGGRITTNAGVNSDPARWIGYQTTRGDSGTRPLIQASGSFASATLVALSSGAHWHQIDVDGNSKTSTNGVTAGAALFSNSKVSNCTNTGVISSAFSTLLSVEVTGTTGGTAGIVSAGLTWDCSTYSNSIPGIQLSGNAVADACLSWGNTGASGHGFLFNGTPVTVLNCTAYGNAQSGFRANSQVNMLINCLSVGNSTYGFSGTTTPNGMRGLNCAAYNNTSGASDSNAWGGGNSGFVTLTADPFVNAAGQNFALNSTSGGGAALRAAGLPASWPGASTSSYPDIGAAQTQTTSGGGGNWIGLV